MNGMLTVLTVINSLIFAVLVAVGLVVYSGNNIEWLPIELVYAEICQEHAIECLKSPDSIHIAVQLGRLDYISTALAILGATVGFTAIFGFLYVKQQASIDAKETATEVAKEEVDQFFEGYESIVKNRIDIMLTEAWSSLEQQIEANKETLGLEPDNDVLGVDGDGIASSIDEGVRNE